MKIRFATVMGIVLAGSVLSLYAAENTAEKTAAVEKKAEAQKAAVEKKAEVQKADIEKKAEMAKAAEKKAEMTQEVWVCPVDHVMSLKASECPMCKKMMEGRHLLGVKGGEALLCSCGATCKCDAKGMKDGKCACGKEVTKMSAKGMYACPMGCPSMSDRAGKCPDCGMEMKKVE